MTKLLGREEGREGKKGGGREERGRGKQGAHLPPPAPRRPPVPKRHRRTPGGHPTLAFLRLGAPRAGGAGRGESEKRTSSPACRAWAPLVTCCISVDLGEHFWSLLGASVLSIPSVTSWISDDLGEYFWSLLAPSLLSIPLVTCCISVDLGEHFWSLLGPSVFSIPLVTS